MLVWSFIQSHWLLHCSRIWWPFSSCFSCHWDPRVSENREKVWVWPGEHQRWPVCPRGLTPATLSAHSISSTHLDSSFPALLAAFLRAREWCLHLLSTSRAFPAEMNFFTTCPQVSFKNQNKWSGLIAHVPFCSPILKKKVSTLTSGNFVIFLHKMFFLVLSYIFRCPFLVTKKGFLKLNVIHCN